MLTNPPLEKLLERAENRYTLSISIAKRARQLQDGARPLLDKRKEKDASLLSLACEEFVEDKYLSLPGKLDPVVPLRPEVEEALREAKKAKVDDDDLIPSFTPIPEKEVPAEPVSKIRIMAEDEMFYMPYEVEDEAETEDEEDIDMEAQMRDPEEEVDEEDDDDDNDTSSYSDSDDEEMVSDEELDSIDGSIDCMSYDEDEDYE